MTQLFGKSSQLLQDDFSVSFLKDDAESLSLEGPKFSWIAEAFAVFGS